MLFRSACGEADAPHHRPDEAPARVHGVPVGTRRTGITYSQPWSAQGTRTQTLQFCSTKCHRRTPSEAVPSESSPTTRVQDARLAAAAADGRVWRPCGASHPVTATQIAYFATLGFSRVLQTTGASMGLACASRLGNAIDLIETTHFQGRRTFTSRRCIL